ncbi:MAG TPA: MgtC/SapB family protein, partial [Steroidobacteraceae bacterium]|nr:MgtC/SapB family protein [Steroidobacteraceae bacterium]
MAPAFEELLSRIALAFGIGLLIGLERGWNTREMQPGSRVAGIRTFGISGLLGGLVAALAAPAGAPPGVGGALLIGLAFAVYAAVFVVFSRDA